MIPSLFGLKANGIKIGILVKHGISEFLTQIFSEMRKIAEQAVEKFSLKKIAIYHRVGSLEIGEVPVVIAAASAHRGAAFDACEYAIDTLKETVPIWKKEIFEDGEVWVSATP